MNGIPRMENNETCTPYLQIFKDAKLLFTSTGRDSTSLRVYTQEDNSILFPVDVTFDGDILIRIRHISLTLERKSMLRFVSVFPSSSSFPPYPFSFSFNAMAK